MAEGRSSHASAASRAAVGPQPDLDSRLQRRRALDARQVGISLVRRLGSGVSHHPAWPWWIRISPSSSFRLLLREWYQSPNGQLPAYEWEFSDVNPPVHPWACWRVFKIDWKLSGKPDAEFLESAFHKLLMNFTWWVNRKDSQGNNIFEGGFLGLDNIGVFDRSKPLPTGGFIEQADGTAWMGMFCLIMLRIAIELTPHDRSYEDIASKFFEHFLYIASAMNRLGDGGLWDEEDGFYLRPAAHARWPQDSACALRSLVGLIPLFAVDHAGCRRRSTRCRVSSGA